MSKLYELTTNIVNDGKMSYDNLIHHIISKMEDECHEACKAEYIDLYKSAYGCEISKDLAETWVHSMSVPEGSECEDGERWTIDITTDVGIEMKIDWTKHSKIEWYIAMNMAYSDYYEASAEEGLEEDPMHYARYAKAWLCDKDVGKNKLFNYYFDVVLA